MSAHWTLYCADCEKYGPDIRRSGSVSLQGLWPRRHPFLQTLAKLAPPTQEEAILTWGLFLDEHEWHKLELHHE